VTSRATGERNPLLDMMEVTEPHHEGGLHDRRIIRICN
jgi:hypothetical protein